MATKVECPKCGTKSVAGRECDGCGLILNMSNVKSLATKSPDKPQLASTVAVPSTPKKKKTKSNKEHKACVKCGEVLTIISRGLCGKCRRAEEKAGTLDLNYPAREKKDGALVKPLTASAVVPQIIENIDANDADIVDAVPPLESATSLGIYLPFGARDAGLFNTLEDMAELERRTVESQIMFLLEKVVAKNIGAQA